MDGGLRSRWGAEALQARLQRQRPGLGLWITPTLESTNSALLEAARTLDGPGGAAPTERPEGAPPCLCVAEIQTRGRGRLGRTWTSADKERPGASLTFSLSMPLGPRASGLSLAVGVALAQALEPAPRPGGPRVLIKWPNDLWLADAGAPGGGRKLGGILIETAATSRGRVAVVGVGLNVQGIVVEGASTGVATWSEVEPGATAAELLHRLAPALVEAFERFASEGLDPFLKGFEARDALRGRAVTTTLETAPFGWAAGVDASGALQVRQADGRMQPVQGGEVSVRPAQTADARSLQGSE